MATFPFSNLIEGIKKIWTVPTGADADNAAVTKNPVLIGGRFSTTPATRHNGDVATLETDSTGRLLTVVSGRKMKVTPIVATSTTTIAPAGTETITISPTTGYMVTNILVMKIYESVISGATTGSHEISLYLDSAIYGFVITATCAYNKILNLYKSGYGTDITVFPIVVGDYISVIKDVKFSASTPLKIKYTNGTDANSTSRLYYFVVLEEAVV